MFAVHKVDENARVKRERTRLAIGLAMDSRWEEALAANRLILQSDPKDVEALNRLGKALSELGHYGEARNAFSKALALSPSNPIAKKNLERIQLLGDDTPNRPQHRRVPPQFFIEETGKTGVTPLMDRAPQETLARMSAGEPVTLQPDNHRLVVKSGDGECLGTIEPKLGLRLVSLMRGGNQYAAAITSVDVHDVKVFIRETRQDPSQRGRPSFPTKGAEDFRPYTWEGLSRFSQDEEDAPSAPGLDWDEGSDDDLPLEPRQRRRVTAGGDDEAEF